MKPCLLILSLLFSGAVHAQTLSGAPPGTPAAHDWPVQDGSFDIATAMVTQTMRSCSCMVPVAAHGHFSDATRGHGTHTQAAVWKDYLVYFLKETAKGLPN